MAEALRILLVDDDPDDRALAIHALRREFSELEVEEVADAAGFAAALEAGRFNAAVIDYRLRWGDGLSVLRAIKARYPDRPVVMFTGTGTEAVAVEAMKAGLDDYVVKAPQHVARLPVALRRALERAEAARRAEVAEAARRASEERFRLLAEVAQDIAIVMLDPAGRVAEWNAGAQAVFGYRAEEVIGEHFGIFRTPEDRAAGLPEQELEQVAREGRAEDDNWLVRKDGGRFWASGLTIGLRNGGPRGFAKIVRDQTEQRRAQEALEARARQQAAVAELGQRALATRDLVALMDEAVAVVARTLGVEHARVLELRPDEQLLLRAGVGWRAGAVGRATVEGGTSSQAGYTLLVHGPVVSEDLGAEGRFRVPTLLLEHGVVSAASVVIHDHDRPYGVLSAETTQRRDFTADDVHFLQAVANVLAAAVRRREFEERLAQERGETGRLAELNRLRGEFVASVSHELRTPLTALRAAFGMVEQSGADRLEPEERDLLVNGRRNAERLSRLIEDLLAHNQLEAGVVEINRERLDLRQVVADAVASVHPLIHQKGQELRIDLPAPLPVEGDAHRLEHVAVNLLANAHQHTPPGTVIAVSGAVADGEVRLVVADDGPGVPAEELMAVFKRFHRPRSAEGGGSGLGLAIAKGLVELHGGRIWAESAAGGGVVFHVVLPRPPIEAEG